MPDAPKLVEAAVQCALNGDTVMLKACFDKLIPNCRQQTRVTVDSTVDKSTPEKGRAVLHELCGGALALEEGRLLMEVLAIQAKLEEQDELAKRVEALEQTHGIH